ncbi:MAG TPA: GDSL-type esterase/lipase family protein, partial [Chthoniobacteraceae bacterium]
TRGLRLRLADDVIALKPKAVNLLIGTNDLALGASPEVVAENIRAIVAELHRANPEMPVIVNKIMPRGAEPGKFPGHIQKVNALLEEAFAADRKVTICDTWGIFADEQGASKKEEFPDMLHPNAAGYAKWKATLQPILEKLTLTKNP